MISIVIPIYKSEQFLRQTITSVLNQKYSDLELILVNDGSPDNSDFICLEFANFDKRVKYIKQKNQGAARAMMRGLNESLGNYVMFLDGDDWINEETLLKANSIIQKNEVDILFWNNYKEFENHSEISRPFLPNSKFFENEDLAWLKRRSFGLSGNELEKITDFDLISSGWGKLYKKEILISDPYILVNNNQVGNFDTELVCRVFNLAKSIYYLNEPLNHYRMGNVNSITKNHGNQLYSKHKIMFISLLQFIEEKNLDYNYKQALFNRITISILNNLLSICSKHNNSSLVAKYKALNSILNDELFKESIINLEFQRLRLTERAFFLMCRLRLTSLVLAAGYLFKFIK